MADKVATVSKIIFEYFVITVGVFIYCGGWTAFITPQGITGGGVTGLATNIQYATNGFIPLYVSYIGINVILLLVGTIILGRGFGFKTIYSILCATFFLAVMPHWHWLMSLSDISDKLVSAVLGGAILAVGISMIFKKGGSTGGTDIIALVFTKYYDTSPGKVFMYCDLIIIGSILFLPGKGLSDFIYGYLTTVSFSYMLDAFLTGRQQSVQILVISGKYQAIADMLISDEHRGVTALDSMGWYTKDESKVLVVVARKYQVAGIMSSIKNIDNRAFVTVGNVSAVYGEGFEKVKVKPQFKEKKSKDEKVRSFLKWINNS
ncbi:MAG: YitT family protein [Bacteroidales bacterium]|jgi:Uncharacterized conserved protein|nr:YitT family protein [Bacteroidales bacterium]MDD3910774.1 YitT family protein [Bacteroidales bacterium]MDD4420539.1 YitT family protein [Bacteroidales bacterium]